MVVSSSAATTEDANQNTEVTFAHELGHLIATALDHYGDNTPENLDGLDIDDNCVWGDNRRSDYVDTTLEMCEYCATRILNAADDIQHS